MPYLHIELDLRQQSKKPDQPCGDVVRWERTREATWVVLADGLGSGIPANLAATFAAERLIALLRREVPLREAFASVAADSERAKKNQGPYAALMLCRVLNDGHATVLTYEMPVPLVTDRQYAFTLESRPCATQGGAFRESFFDLQKGSTLILVSDGVTQAGLGRSLPRGWGEDGVVRYVNRSFQTGTAAAALAPKILEQAQRLDQSAQHDDISVVSLHARSGQVVNIFSGPPAETERDASVLRNFLDACGIKVICGTSTAALAARQMGRVLKMEKSTVGYVEPPRYDLPGVDMVTEGAVTLNQVYNLLDEKETAPLNTHGGVASLHALLHFADRVNWTVGRALNPAHQDIRFTQMGVLPRLKIIPLLVEKLKAQGKLVVVDYV